MSNYAKRLKRSATMAAWTVACLMAAVSCTEVNDELGMGFIPKDQQMMVSISALGHVETYQAWSDSVMSDRLTYSYLGSTQSPVFGGTVAGIVMQCAVPDENSDRFGNTIYYPKEDSVVMGLAVTDVRGDSTVEQRFLVYEVNSSAVLDRDSAYYTNYPVDDVIEPDPLFAFSYVGGRGDVRIPVEVLPAGEQYMKRLLTADSLTYTTDSLFHEKFRGLYVKPADKKQAAMYQIYMKDSYMDVYARVFRDYNHTIVMDTISAEFPFDNTVYHNNTSVNVVEHDYAGSLVTAINDTLPTSQPLSKVYIQNLGGVITYLRFTDRLIEAIEALKLHEGVQYRDIAINQAMFFIKLDDATIGTMNAAQSRLGMYYRYKYPIATIPDYQYEYEAQGNELPYGGYLARSLGMYQMDVTSYVQKLVHNESTPRTVFLGATAGADFSFGEVALLGSASPGGVQLKLTYTLIK